MGLGEMAIVDTFCTRCQPVREESSAIPLNLNPGKLCHSRGSEHWVFDMAVPVSNGPQANRTHALRTARAFYEIHVAPEDLTQ